MSTFRKALFSGFSTDIRSDDHEKMDRDRQLVLVRASRSRGGGHWSADDCDLRLGDAAQSNQRLDFLQPAARAASSEQNHRSPLNQSILVTA